MCWRPWKLLQEHVKIFWKVWNKFTELQIEHKDTQSCTVNIRPPSCVTHTSLILLVCEPGKCVCLRLILPVTFALCHLFSFEFVSFYFPFCSYILHNVSWDLNSPPLMSSLSEVWACAWRLDVLPFISRRSANLVWLPGSFSPLRASPVCSEALGCVLQSSCPVSLSFKQ